MEYIYIFRSYIKDGTLLKFGYTADIWSRLATYKSANPGIEIVYIAQLADAYKLEQAFQNLKEFLETEDFILLKMQTIEKFRQTNIAFTYTYDDFSAVVGACPVGTKKFARLNFKKD